ncbi:MAG: autotransporter-associated beta strand repeat-containing protein [Puniceicoccales bacterium]|jgi:autotransporter-associated beta strand protein|nr:autotransporter-associated beta strand repeat-containing protein [Puniceicoccales bacterium]
MKPERFSDTPFTGVAPAGAALATAATGDPTADTGTDTATTATGTAPASRSVAQTLLSVGEASPEATATATATATQTGLSVLHCTAPAAAGTRNNVLSFRRKLRLGKTALFAAATALATVAPLPDAPEAKAASDIYQYSGLSGSGAAWVGNPSATADVPPSALTTSGSANAIWIDQPTTATAVPTKTLLDTSNSSGHDAVTLYLSAVYFGSNAWDVPYNWNKMQNGYLLGANGASIGNGGTNGTLNFGNYSGLIDASAHYVPEDTYNGGGGATVAFRINANVTSHAGLDIRTNSLDPAQITTRSQMFALASNNADTLFGAVNIDGGYVAFTALNPDPSGFGTGSQATTPFGSTDNVVSFVHAGGIIGLALNSLYTVGYRIVVTESGGIVRALAMGGNAASNAGNAFSANSGQMLYAKTIAGDGQLVVASGMHKFDQSADARLELTGDIYLLLGSDFLSHGGTPTRVHIGGTADTTLNQKISGSAYNEKFSTTGAGNQVNMGTVTLTKYGVDTITLTNPENYQAPFYAYIQEGTLAFNDAKNVFSSVLRFNRAVGDEKPDVNPTNSSTALFLGTGDLGALRKITLQNNTATVKVLHSGATLTVEELAIASGLTLTKDGAGTLALKGAAVAAPYLHGIGATNLGNIAVKAGTLELARVPQLSGTAIGGVYPVNISLDAGATLKITGSGLKQFGTLALSAGSVLDIAGASLLTTSQTSDTTLLPAGSGLALDAVNVAARITNSVAGTTGTVFLKNTGDYNLTFADGAGRLGLVFNATGGVYTILSGNTYTGPTNVYGGTLTVAATGALPKTSPVSLFGDNGLNVNHTDGLPNTLFGAGVVAYGETATPLPVGVSVAEGQVLRAKEFSHYSKDALSVTGRLSAGNVVLANAKTVLSAEGTFSAEKVVLKNTAGATVTIAAAAGGANPPTHLQHLSLDASAVTAPVVLELRRNGGALASVNLGAILDGNQFGTAAAVTAGRLLLLSGADTAFEESKAYDVDNTAVPGTETGKKLPVISGGSHFKITGAAGSSDDSLAAIALPGIFINGLPAAAVSIYGGNYVDDGATTTWTARVNAQVLTPLDDTGFTDAVGKLIAADAATVPALGDTAHRSLFVKKTDTTTIDLATGTLTLGDTGGTQGDSGFLSLAAGAGDLTVSGGTLAIASSGELRLLNASSSSTLRVEADISAGSVGVFGPGTTVLAGTSPYAGVATIYSGVLKVESATALSGDDVTLGFRSGAGTFNYADTDADLSLSKAIDLGGSEGVISVEAALRKVTAAAGVSGGGVLRKTGAGTLALAGTGAGLTLRAEAGRVSLDATGAADALVISGEAIVTYTSANAIGSAIVLEDGTLNLNGYPQTASAVTLSGSTGSVITNSGSGTSTISVRGDNNVFAGDFSASVALRLDSGVFTLSGVNSTAAGNMEIGAGATLVVTSADAIFGGASLTAEAGSTLRYEGTTTAPSKTLTLTTGAPATFDITKSGGVFIASQIAGATTLIKTGAGTLQIGEAGNTQASAAKIVVNAGTVVLAKGTGGSAIPTGSVGTPSLTINNAARVSIAPDAADGQFVNTSVLEINSDGVLDLGSSTETILAIYGDGGTITASGAATLTTGIDIDGITPLTVAAAFTGNLSLKKQGANPLVLAGNTAYTGTTTVNTGTLQIGDNSNGDLPSGAFVLESGTTLRIYRSAASQGTNTAVDARQNLEVTLNGLSGADATLQKDGGATLVIAGEVNVKNYTHNNGDLVVKAPVTVTGAFSFIAQANDLTLDYSDYTGTGSLLNLGTNSLNLGNNTLTIRGGDNTGAITQTFAGIGKVAGGEIEGIAGSAKIVIERGAASALTLNLGRLNLAFGERYLDLRGVDNEVRVYASASPLVNLATDPKLPNVLWEGAEFTTIDSEGKIIPLPAIGYDLPIAGSISGTGRNRVLLNQANTSVSGDVTVESLTYKASTSGESGVLLVNSTLTFNYEGRGVISLPKATSATPENFRIYTTGTTGALIGKPDLLILNGNPSRTADGTTFLTPNQRSVITIALPIKDSPTVPDRAANTSGSNSTTLTTSLHIAGPGTVVFTGDAKNSTFTGDITITEGVLETDIVFSDGRDNAGGSVLGGYGSVISTPSKRNLHLYEGGTLRFTGGSESTGKQSAGVLSFVLKSDGTGVVDIADASASVALKQFDGGFHKTGAGTLILRPLKPVRFEAGMATSTDYPIFSETGNSGNLGEGVNYGHLVIEQGVVAVASSNVNESNFVDDNSNVSGARGTISEEGAEVWKGATLRLLVSEAVSDYAVLTVDGTLELIPTTDTLGYNTETIGGLFGGSTGIVKMASVNAAGANITSGNAKLVIGDDPLNFTNLGNAGVGHKHGYNDTDSYFAGSIQNTDSGSTHVTVSIEKRGQGTLTLTGDSTFTGPKIAGSIAIDLIDGVISFDHAGSLGGSGALGHNFSGVGTDTFWAASGRPSFYGKILLRDGTTLRYTGAGSETLNRYILSGGANDVYTLEIEKTTANLTLTALGNGRLVKTGAGTLIIGDIPGLDPYSNLNPNIGATLTVAEGTVVLAKTEGVSIQGANGIFILDAGTLRLSPRVSAGAITNYISGVDNTVGLRLYGGTLDLNGARERIGRSDTEESLAPLYADAGLLQNSSRGQDASIYVSTFYKNSVGTLQIGALSDTKPTDVLAENFTLSGGGILFAADSSLSGTRTSVEGYNISTLTVSGESFISGTGTITANLVGGTAGQLLHIGGFGSENGTISLVMSGQSEPGSPFTFFRGTLDIASGTTLRIGDATGEKNSTIGAIPVVVAPGGTLAFETPYSNSLSTITGGGLVEQRGAGAVTMAGGTVSVVARSGGGDISVSGNGSVLRGDMLAETGKVVTVVDADTGAESRVFRYSGVGVKNGGRIEGTVTVQDLASVVAGAGSISQLVLQNDGGVITKEDGSAETGIRIRIDGVVEFGADGNADWLKVGSIIQSNGTGKVIIDPSGFSGLENGKIVNVIQFGDFPGIEQWLAPVTEEESQEAHWAVGQRIVNWEVDTGILRNTLTLGYYPEMNLIYMEVSGSNTETLIWSGQTGTNIWRMPQSSSQLWNWRRVSNSFDDFFHAGDAVIFNDEVAIKDAYGNVIGTIETAHSVTVNQSVNPRLWIVITDETADDRAFSFSGGTVNAALNKFGTGNIKILPTSGLNAPDHVGTSTIRGGNVEVAYLEVFGRQGNIINMWDGSSLTVKGIHNFVTDVIRRDYGIEGSVTLNFSGLKNKDVPFGEIKSLATIDAPDATIYSEVVGPDGNYTGEVLFHTHPQAGKPAILSITTAADEWSGTPRTFSFEGTPSGRDYSAFIGTLQLDSGRFDFGPDANWENATIGSRASNLGASGTTSDSLRTEIIFGSAISTKDAKVKTLENLLNSVTISTVGDYALVVLDGNITRRTTAEQSNITGVLTLSGKIVSGQPSLTINTGNTIDSDSTTQTVLKFAAGDNAAIFKVGSARAVVDGSTLLGENGRLWVKEGTLQLASGNLFTEATAKTIVLNVSGGATLELGKSIASGGSGLALETYVVGGANVGGYTGFTAPGTATLRAHSGWLGKVFLENARVASLATAATHDLVFSQLKVTGGVSSIAASAADVPAGLVPGLTGEFPVFEVLSGGSGPSAWSATLVVGVPIKNGTEAKPLNLSGGGELRIAGGASNTGAWRVLGKSRLVVTSNTTAAAATANGVTVFADGGVIEFSEDGTFPNYNNGLALGGTTVAARGVTGSDFEQTYAPGATLKLNYSSSETEAVFNTAIRSGVFGAENDVNAAAGLLAVTSGTGDIVKSGDRDVLLSNLSSAAFSGSILVREGNLTAIGAQGLVRIEVDSGASLHFFTNASNRTTAAAVTLNNGYLSYAGHDRSGLAESAEPKPVDITGALTLSSGHFLRIGGSNSSFNHAVLRVAGTLNFTNTAAIGFDVAGQDDSYFGRDEHDVLRVTTLAGDATSGFIKLVSSSAVGLVVAAPGDILIPESDGPAVYELITAAKGFTLDGYLVVDGTSAVDSLLGHFGQVGANGQDVSGLDTSLSLSRKLVFVENADGSQTIQLVVEFVGPRYIWAGTTSPGTSGAASNLLWDVNTSQNWVYRDDVLSITNYPSTVADNFLVEFDGRSNASGDGSPAVSTDVRISEQVKPLDVHIAVPDVNSNTNTSFNFTLGSTGSIIGGGGLFIGRAGVAYKPVTVTFKLDAGYTGAGNEFTGAVRIMGGSTLVLNNLGSTVPVIANAGQPSLIGAGSGARTLVIDSSTLQFVSAPGNIASTDRSLTVGGAGATLISDGGRVMFVNDTSALAYASTTDSAVKLTLGGSGEGVLALRLESPAGASLIVEKTGAGIWWLANNENSFSGGTWSDGSNDHPGTAIVVSDGTIVFEKQGASGVSLPNGEGGIVLNGGALSNRAYSVGAVIHAAASEVHRNIFVAQNSGVEVASGNLKLSGLISGISNRDITKTGTGDLIISADNRSPGFFGAFIVSDGSLSLANTYAAGAAGKVNLLSPTSILYIGADAVSTVELASLSGSGRVVAAAGSDATLRLAFASSAVFAGSFEDGARLLLLEKTGGGTLELTGQTSTHTGLNTVAQGMLKPTYSPGDPSYSGGFNVTTTTADMTGSLDIAGQDFSPLNATIAGSGYASRGAVLDSVGGGVTPKLLLAANATVRTAGETTLISAAKALGISGTPVLTFAAAYGTNGVWLADRAAILSGVDIAIGDTLGANTTLRITASGAFASTTSAQFAGSLAELRLENGTLQTLAGLSGPGSVGGDGVLTLALNNTKHDFTGTLKDSVSLIALGGGELTLTAVSTTTGEIRVRSNAILTLTAPLAASGTADILGALGASASRVVLENGVLRSAVSAPDPLLATPSVTTRDFIFEGTTSEFRSDGNTPFQLKGAFIAGTVAGDHTLTLSGTTAFTSPSGDNRLESVLEDPANGSLAIVKAGAGTWTVGAAGSTSANTFSGGVTIKNGALRIGADNALGADSALTLGDVVANTGGQLDLAGHSQAFSSLVSAGLAAARNSIHNASGSGAPTPTLTVSVNGAAPANFTGRLGIAGNAQANDLAFEKSGAGTFVLTQTEPQYPFTYTGETRVSEGTLKLAGPIELASTAINVLPGARLDTTGVTKSSGFTIYGYRAPDAISDGHGVATLSAGGGAAFGLPADLLGNYLLDGGILAVGGASGSRRGEILNATGTLATATASAIQLYLSNSIHGANSRLNFDTLNFTETVRLGIHFSDGALAVGTYVIAEYRTLTGYDKLVLPSTGYDPRYILNLENQPDAGPGTGEIWLTISSEVMFRPNVWRGDQVGPIGPDGQPVPITGADGETIWDARVGNFTNPEGLPNQVYFPGASALFDDSGESTRIFVGSSVSIGRVVFNNYEKDYTIFGGSISGTGYIEKRGTGRLTLASANEFGGITDADGSPKAAVILAEGTLAVGNDGALGRGAVLLTGGTLAADFGDDIAPGVPATGVRTLDNDIFVAPGAFTALESGQGSDLVLRGKFASDGEDLVLQRATLVEKRGAGRLVFANNGAGFTGELRVVAGAVSFDTADFSGAFVNLITPGVSFSVLAETGVGMLAGVAGSEVSGSGVLRVGARGESSVFAGDISGTLSLWKEGVGTLSLTGDNSALTGTIRVAEGRLQFGDGANGVAPTGDVEVLEGAEVIFKLPGVVPLAQDVSGAGSLIKDGTGTLVVNKENNRLTGFVRVNDGVLEISGSGALGTASIETSGVVRLARAGNYVLPNNISGAGILEKTESGKAVWTGSGDVNLHVTAGVFSFGDGVLVLTQKQKRETRVDSGATLLLAPASGGSVTLGDLAAEAGAFVEKNGSGLAVLTGVLNVSDSILVNDGTLAVGDGTGRNEISVPASFSVRPGAALTFNRAGATLLGGAITAASGSAVEFKSGETVLLAAGNVFAGPVAIRSGAVLQVGGADGASSLGAAQVPVAVDAGGTLRYTNPLPPVSGGAPTTGANVALSGFGDVEYRGAASGELYFNSNAQNFAGVFRAAQGVFIFRADSAAAQGLPDSATSVVLPPVFDAKGEGVLKIESSLPAIAISPRLGSGDGTILLAPSAERTDAAFTIGAPLSFSNGTFAVARGASLDLSSRSVAATVLEVREGATLTGNGAVVGELNNRGEIRPAGGNGVEVRGDVYQNGTLRLEAIGSAATAAVLSYSGTAWLGENSILRLDTTQSIYEQLRAGRPVSVLHDTSTTSGTGDIGGAFGSISVVVDGMEVTSPAMTFAAADGWLSLLLADDVTLLPGFSLHKGLGDYARYLTDSLRDPASSGFIAELINSRDWNRLFNAMSPAGLASITAMSIGGSRDDAEGTHRHLESLRYHRGIQGRESGSQFYLSGASRFERNRAGGAATPAFNYDLFGGAVGFDQSIGDYVTAGLSASYHGGRASLAYGAGKVNQDNARLNFYGTVMLNDILWADAVLNAGYSDYNIRHTNSRGTAKARPEGYDFGASTRLGFVAAVNKDVPLSFTPYVGLDYASAHVDAFTEAGSDTALHLDAFTQDSLRFNVGTGASWTLNTKLFASARFALNAAYTYELLDTDVEMTARLASDNVRSFKANVPALPRQTVRVAPVLDLGLTADTSLQLSYQFETGFNSTFVHSFNAVFRLRF